MLLQEMLQAGLIVAGWDSTDGGSVYAVPLGGTLVKCPFAIGETRAVTVIDCPAKSLQSLPSLHNLLAAELHT